MRDHRHDTIECYLGQLAPPRVRKRWRQQEKRWDKRWKKRWRRGPGLLLRVVGICWGIATLAYFANEFLLPSDSPWRRSLTAAALILFIISFGPGLLLVRRVQAFTTRVLSRRCKRWRTREYNGGEIGRDGIDATAADTASDLQARYVFWRWRVGQPLAVGQFGVATNLGHWPLFVCLAVFWALAVGEWIELYWPELSGIVTTMQVIGTLVWFGSSIWILIDIVRFRRQVLCAIEERRCTACGCDPRGVDISDLPPCCPECGFAWPLVLPPAYTSEDLAGERRRYLFYRNPNVDPHWEDESA